MLQFFNLARWEQQANMQQESRENSGKMANPGGSELSYSASSVMKRQAACWVAVFS